MPEGQSRPWPPEIPHEDEFADAKTELFDRVKAKLAKLLTTIAEKNFLTELNVNDVAINIVDQLHMKRVPAPFVMLSVGRHLRREYPDIGESDHSKKFTFQPAVGKELILGLTYTTRKVLADHLVAEQWARVKRAYRPRQSRESDQEEWERIALQRHKRRLRRLYRELLAGPGLSDADRD